MEWTVGFSKSPSVGWRQLPTARSLWGAALEWTARSLLGSSVGVDSGVLEEPLSRLATAPHGAELVGRVTVVWALAFVSVDTSVK